MGALYLKWSGFYIDWVLDWDLHSPQSKARTLKMLIIQHKAYNYYYYHQMRIRKNKQQWVGSNKCILVSWRHVGRLLNFKWDPWGNPMAKSEKGIVISILPFWIEYKIHSLRVIHDTNNTQPMCFFFPIFFSFGP